jgi:hypothetical protein
MNFYGAIHPSFSGGGDWDGDGPDRGSFNEVSEAALDRYSVVLTEAGAVDFAAAGRILLYQFQAGLLFSR